MIREQRRGSIAFQLIMLLLVAVFATIALPIIMSLIGIQEDPTSVIQDIGTTVLTPIVGLIGAVIGFYFGGARTPTQRPTPPSTEGDGQ